jgi:hypothetical protein
VKLAWSGLVELPKNSVMAEATPSLDVRLGRFQLVSIVFRLE